MEHQQNNHPSGPNNQESPPMTPRTQYWRHRDQSFDNIKRTVDQLITSRPRERSDRSHDRYQSQSPRERRNERNRDRRPQRRREPSSYSDHPRSNRREDCRQEDRRRPRPQNRNRNRSYERDDRTTNGRTINRCHLWHNQINMH